MNRAEYDKILQNIKGILQNPNGNFEKKFLTGSSEENADTLEQAELIAAVALITVDEFYAYLTKAAHEGGVSEEL